MKRMLLAGLIVLGVLLTGCPPDGSPENKEEGGFSFANTTWTAKVGEVNWELKFEEYDSEPMPGFEFELTENNFPRASGIAEGAKNAKKLDALDGGFIFTASADGKTVAISGNDVEDNDPKTMTKKE